MQPWVEEGFSVQIEILVHNFGFHDNFIFGEFLAFELHEDTGPHTLPRFWRVTVSWAGDTHNE